MLLDVFKDDAFHFTKLTTAINLVPYLPTRVGSLGWFSVVPVSTVTIAIEMQNNVLSLVPSKARGEPGTPKGLGRRNIRDLRSVHLPQTFSVMADEIANLRAFGSESEVEVLSRYTNRKAAVPRRDLDLTHEWQRMGALRGQVIDADGTTVLANYFTEFGVTQQTANFALSNSATKLVQVINGFKRLAEDAAGGVMISGWRALCSPEFHDVLTGHPAAIEAFKYQQSNTIRSDNRRGFDFGDVIWEEYRGQVGATRFVPANKAYLVPEGVPDLFQTFYSPANYMETVNTEGLPFYMRPNEMDFNKGVQFELQSNPLHLCTRPNVIIELTAT